MVGALLAPSVAEQSKTVTLSPW
uniref:Uncharacterized protein n=1 Tax=Rhizophora mucronata TaxID=61149 RepID=A0A2P2NBJ4_RHIMU